VTEEATFPNIRPDSVQRSAQYDIRDTDIQSHEDLSLLIQLMFEFPERSFYLYSREDTGIKSKVLGASRTGDILIAISEHHFYEHPKFKDDFVRIRRGRTQFDWEVEVLEKSPAFVRHTLKLSERARQRLSDRALLERMRDGDFTDHEQIIRTMQSMAKLMERHPGPFRGLGEEEIRTHFMLGLGAKYQGQVTAESLNSRGKTDILIRSGDRTVLVVECKIWHGPKALTGTIDQLLSYLTWRDDQSAILLFSRNVRFSGVLKEIPPTVRAHPKFAKQLPNLDETTFRYVVRHVDDDQRDISLTVLAFNVPRPT